MSERILSIEEVENVPHPDHDGWCEGDGFRVTTDRQEILLWISRYQFCCESWGYFVSEDDLQHFVGAELLGVSVVDTGLCSKKLPEYGLDEGDTMFVNIETSEGVLQFTAYNAHNGYYGHYAGVRSTQITHETTL